MPFQTKTISNTVYIKTTLLNISAVFWQVEIQDQSEYNKYNVIYENPNKLNFYLLNQTFVSVRIQQYACFLSFRKVFFIRIQQTVSLLYFKKKSTCTLYSMSESYACFRFFQFYFYFLS